MQMKLLIVLLQYLLQIKRSPRSIILHAFWHVFHPCIKFVVTFYNLYVIDLQQANAANKAMP